MWYCVLHFLCRPLDLENLDLEKAVELLRYPLPLGNHPDDNEPVTLNCGKFGFYVQAGDLRANIPKVLTWFSPTQHNYRTERKLQSMPLGVILGTSMNTGGLGSLHLACSA